MESCNGKIANGPKRVVEKLLKYEQPGFSTRYQKNVYDGICIESIFRWHKTLVLFLGKGLFYFKGGGTMENDWDWFKLNYRKRRRNELWNFWWTICTTTIEEKTI